jgi:hypothetical protein
MGLSESRICRLCSERNPLHFFSAQITFCLNIEQTFSELHARTQQISEDICFGSTIRDRALSSVVRRSGVHDWSGRVRLRPRIPVPT